MKNNIWKIAALALVLTACKSAPTQSTGAEATSAKSSASTAQGAWASDKIYAAYLSNRQIYFDYDSDVMRSQYKDLIAVHAKYLKSHPQTKLLLQGHSDERGTPAYNLDLGQRRAVAVKNAFNAQGIKNAQLETISYGNQQASHDCNNEECHKSDRRVDITYGIK